MHVTSLPMRWKSGDNYCYILTDESSNKSWIIDPAFPNDIEEYLLKKNKSDIVSIVNTHHHNDHSGGNKYLSTTIFKNIPIIAGHDSPGVSYTPSDNEIIQLGDNIEVTAIHTPCHTQDSICYYAVDKKTKQKCVFTGDTLFISGCGRFFEGNGEQMDKSLGKLMSLPSNTIVYPGHEYTESNVKFSLSVLGQKNEALNNLKNFCIKNEITTGKFTIGDEKLFNPFVRLDDPEVLKATGLTDPIEIMDKLRIMKNNF
ncbi:Cytoplasmic glyoxalase II [Pichia californica]|uniref:hydroxyacylglutathione hydrolase n=1 Tax=Pichia californica TaxID=460514 RepID=A0A9P6WHR9_9ASCO|nr:Cytoplasmic glyoxalase II [[Candida] californica]KAG0687116.1 Cytoplasmic glyoxalase II [[Candida] californica]